jgi:hypothetical protein
MNIIKISDKKLAQLNGGFGLLTWFIIVVASMAVGALINYLT